MYPTKIHKILYSLGLDYNLHVSRKYNQHLDFIILVGFKKLLVLLNVRN